MESKWKRIQNEIKVTNQILQSLVNELTEIQKMCEHTNLLKHKINEEYMDECPDCGHIFYSYKI